MESTQEVSLTRQERVLYSHFIPGQLFTETHTVPRGERPLEDIASDLLLDPTAYAFCLEEIITTTVNVDGRSIQLASQPRKSPLTYVGGTLYTLEEVQAQYPEKKTMIENMTDVGAVRVILTRTGHWLPFQEFDQFLAEPIGDSSIQQEEHPVDIQDALRELVEERGYRDATELLRNYYISSGAGGTYSYLCTLQAPNGSPIYCRTPKEVLRVLETARAKNETNASRTAPEPIDSPPWTLVGNFDIEDDE